MVNFNNESNVAQSASEIMRIIILEARYNTREAIEAHLKLPRETEPDTRIIRARLWSFYAELRSALLRRNKQDEETINNIKQIGNELTQNETDINSLLSIFYNLSDELDTWKLTVIDNREQYDTTNAGAEDEAKNL